MSVRIKVSYTEELELAKLQRRLAPGIERCSLPRVQKGKHKRAYIDWNSNVTNPNGNVTKWSTTKNNCSTPNENRVQNPANIRE